MCHRKHTACTTFQSVIIIIKRQNVHAVSETFTTLGPVLHLLFYVFLLLYTWLRLSTCY